MGRFQSANDNISRLEADPPSERRLAESEIGLALTERLTQLRERIGLSQEELGRRVGRSQGYIEKLEGGAYEGCSVPAVRTFARAMGYDVDLSGLFVPAEQNVFSGGVGVDALLDERLRASERAASRDAATAR